MKKIAIILLLTTAAWLGLSTQSQAQFVTVPIQWTSTYQWDYLNGQVSAAACSQEAGTLGYPYYSFGGYVWNGFQWLYLFNGCFGAPARGVPVPNPADAHYDVYARDSSSAGLQACLDDLKFEIDHEVIGRIDSGNGKIQLKSPVPVLQQICAVGCVKQAYRTNPNGTTAPTSCGN